MDSFFTYEKERTNCIQHVNNQVKSITGFPHITRHVNTLRQTLQTVIEEFCYECYDRETYVLVKMDPEFIRNHFPVMSSTENSFESCKSETTDSSDSNNSNSNNSESNDKHFNKSDFPDDYMKVLAIFGHDFCNCSWKKKKNPTYSHDQCLQNATQEINKNDTKESVKYLLGRKSECETKNHLYYKLWFDYSGDICLCGIECYDCIFEDKLKNDSEYDDYTLSTGLK